MAPRKELIPSTSFYIDLEYLVFFDDIDNEDKVIGFDYYASLLSSVDDETLQNIREVVKITDVSDIAQPNLAKDHGIAPEQVVGGSGVSGKAFLLAVIGLFVLIFIVLYKVSRN